MGAAGSISPVVGLCVCVCVCVCLCVCLVVADTPDLLSEMTVSPKAADFGHVDHW